MILCYETFLFGLVHISFEEGEREKIDGLSPWKRDLSVDKRSGFSVF